MKIWFPQKYVSTEQPDNNIFLQHAAIQSIGMMLLTPYAINTINPFKQLKRALESKLSNFKIFENC